MWTRLSTGLLLSVVVVGCLSGPVGSPSGTPTSTATPSPTPVTTGSWGDPRPDHKEVTLENRWTAPVEFDIRVVDGGNRTLYAGTHEVEPGTTLAVYNTSTDIEGVKPVTVFVTARGTSRNVTVETSTCYAGPYTEVDEEGTLSVGYAVC